MVDAFANSHITTVASNGFCFHCCSSCLDYRIIKHFVGLNYASFRTKRKANVRAKFSLSDYGCIINGSLKFRKLMNVKVKVATVEHELEKFLSFNDYEDFDDNYEDEDNDEEDDDDDEDDDDSGDDGEKPVWENSILTKDKNGDDESSSLSSTGLNESETKTRLCYLEEVGEEVLSERLLALSRTNRKESALVLFRSMDLAGLRPSSLACNALLSCLLRRNMVDDMMEVFVTMKHKMIISGHSCSLVLKAVAGHDGSHAALEMFFEWLGESEVKSRFDAIVYNTILSILAKENKWLEMWKVWNSMKENRCIGTTVTYCVLICTFVRCGQYEMAIDAYHEMLQNGIQPRHDAMRAVIGACMKEGMWDLGSSVFHSMLECELKPDLITCNAVMNSLGKGGKVTAAYKVYQKIKVLGYEPDSYTWKALLGALYRAEQYDDALQFFYQMQKDLGFKPNIYLYDTALMCCQKLGDWQKALQLLWKMESSGLAVPTSSYNIVIYACEAAEQPAVALQVYEHMKDENCIPDTFTHLSLLRSCIWGGLWKNVMDILNESENDSLYNAAIQGMCLKRELASAKKLYIKMREIGLVPDGKTRVLMLQFLRKG